LSAPDQLLEAWAVLAAATADERVIRVEPAGVTVPLGDVLAGIDIHGGRHLLVPVADLESVREDRRSAGVQIRHAVLEESGASLSFLDVVCLVPSLNDLFAEVASDMLEALLVDASDPARVCHEVLERWRELLNRPDPRLLGPQQLAGLFGELLFVKELAERDPQHGIDAWTGPAKSQHDLTRGSLAVEVKTTTVREGRVVQIHGAEQLDAPSSGHLFLAFIRLDVEGNGTSVPQLVDEILNHGVERRTLFDLLAQAGYDPAKSQEYEHPLFVARERRLYAVLDEFPRIVGETFARGRVPPGVLRLRYEVDLTNEPPSPLDDQAVDRVLSSLARSS
jgi:Putative  PD-(D/E)XK family member, (DUF4420)